MSFNTHLQEEKWIASILDEYKPTTNYGDDPPILDPQPIFNPAVELPHHPKSDPFKWAGKPNSNKTVKPFDKEWDQFSQAPSTMAGPHAKQWFLTWAKCTLSKEAALLLITLCVSAPLAAYVICEELHKDGTPHLHAYLKYERKVNLNGNMRKFDLRAEGGGGTSQNGQMWVCNVTTARGAAQCIAYAKKGGNYISKDVELHIKPIDVAIQLASKGKRKEALELLWLNEGRLMLTQGVMVKAQLGTRHKRLYKTPYPSFSPIQALTDWVDGIARDGVTTSLVLSGPSGCGKTSWARSLSEDHLFVTHMDDLRKFDEHDLLVFDDMHFGHKPRSAKLHIAGTSDEASIHIRYTTADIPAGVARIFCTNVTCVGGYAHPIPGTNPMEFYPPTPEIKGDVWGDKEHDMADQNDPAIDRRCTYVHIPVGTVLW